MFAIYKRELKSYLQSFIGFLFMAVVLFFVGIYYINYNILYGYPYFATALSSSSFIFFISIPIITSRVLAEERKNKTDQLILTAPVTVTDVVLGKYLALATLFAIPVLIICCYPLLMSIFGAVSMAETYCGILGFFLYGLTCIAIGVFVSSLTESPMIATVIGFAVILIGYLMDGICNLISETGNLITKILGCYDLSGAFSKFINGTFNITGIVYFISVTVLFLFLTTQSVQKRRWSVSKDKITFGAYSLGGIVVVVAAVIMCNLLVNTLPEKYVNFDITENQLYSIGDETRSYVESLQKDVEIYVLAGESSKDAVMEELLKRYQQASKHIKVQYVDPVVTPNFYKQYTDKTVNTNSVIVVCEGKSRVIDYYDIYQTEIDYSTYTQNVTGFDGEGLITSAIAYVTNEASEFVYVVSGHGETSNLDQTFQDAITKLNIEVRELNLLQTDSIDMDAQFVILNAPQSDLSDEEYDTLTDYLENGGNLLVMKAFLENADSFPNLKKLFASYGMELTEGLVTETDRNYYYQVPYFLLPDMYNNLYTENLFNQYYVFFPYSQGIITAETDDISFINIVHPSGDSFIKTDFQNAQSYDFEEGDIDENYPLMVAATKSNGDTESTMVLVASEMAFTESASAMVSGSNIKLFTNTVGQLSGEIQGVSIPIKDYSVTYLVVTPKNAILIGIAVVIVLPLALIIAGFIIWFRRRKK